jgi:hypothetical protein
MPRLGKRLLIELGRLGLAFAVAYGCARGVESTCPRPTPENSSPGCEGLSYFFGAFVGFFGTLVVSLLAERVWRSLRRRRQVRRPAS